MTTLTCATARPSRSISIQAQTMSEQVAPQVPGRPRSHHSEGGYEAEWNAQHPPTAERPAEWNPGDLSPRLI